MCLQFEEQEVKLTTKTLHKKIKYDITKVDVKINGR